MLMYAKKYDFIRTPSILFFKNKFGTVVKKNIDTFRTYLLTHSYHF